MGNDVKNGLKHAALLILLFVVFMSAGAVLAPDAVRSHSAPNQFDANAARTRFARVLGAQRTHPVDTDANDAVRARLLAEIQALGYTPEVRDQVACTSPRRFAVINCARVRNIVFSAGPTNGDALLLAAHYDSVPAGPGASDDGIGVAAWLEIAARLKSEPLQRRVIFLFTDGEEPGLVGGKAFAASDPLYASVRSIVNLEARGTRGPAIFFETNSPNANAIRAYEGAPRPLANSVMADIYRLLPNNTDVSTLRRDGVDVVNISILDGVENYHTPRDTLANQDLASLQSLGDQGLSVARAFATRASAPARGDMVFSDLVTRGFIALPQLAAIIALGICTAVALIMFWRKPPPLWPARFWPLAALVAVVAFSYAAGFALSTLKPDYWFAHPEFTRAWTILSALTSISMMLWLARGVAAETLGAAGAFWFAAIGFGVSLAVPGATILFLPPCAIYAVGAIAALVWPPAAKVGAAAATMAALVIFAPVIALMEIALGYDLPTATALPVAIVLLPAIGLLAGGAWRWPAIAAAGATVIAVIVTFLAPAHTAERPQPLNILTIANVDTREAHLIAGAAEAPLPPELAHAAHFEPALVLPWDETQSWAAPAPYTNAPAADATLIANESASSHVMRLRLVANGAYRTSVRIPRAAQPTRVSINGVGAEFAALQPDDDYAIFTCWGRACDGAEITITLGAETRDDWYVTGFYPYSLSATPPEGAALVAARPATATPIQNGDGTYTVRKLALAR